MDGVGKKNPTFAAVALLPHIIDGRVEDVSSGFDPKLWACGIILDPGILEYQLAQRAIHIRVLGSSPSRCACPTTPLMTSSLSMGTTTFMRLSHDATMV